MKIVLDSNILVVAIGQRSRFRPIWQAFLDERYQLILTGEILLEYEEILQEHAAPGAMKLSCKSLPTQRISCTSGFSTSGML
jgi:rRNA-processing protein FCF1